MSLISHLCNRSINQFQAAQEKKEVSVLKCPFVKGTFGIASTGAVDAKI